MNDVSDDTSDANKQKVTFNQSVQYASNPTTVSTSLNTSNRRTPATTANNKLTSSSSFKSPATRATKPSSQLSIDKLSTGHATSQSTVRPLRSSNLINQLKLFKLQLPKSTGELNKISEHNQRPKKMRTIHTTASEKNAEFKTKYGLNRTTSSNGLTGSLLNKPAKSKPGLVVDEQTTVSKEPVKGIFDSGPVLVSTTVSKNLDHYKLPYNGGENVETNEFGEQTWKHKNVRAYEERDRRRIRQEFDVPASAVVKKLNEPFKLDKNNNEQTATKSSSAQKKYIYGMNLSGGVLDEEGGKSSRALVLHSNSNTATTARNYSPFKEQSRFNSNGIRTFDKAIQCELKKSKSAVAATKERQFSETGWKHYVEEPEEPRFREFSTDKWYYDKHEFEPGEIIPGSRQTGGIGEHHQVHKWTKDINPSSLEQKVETKKTVDTEYKHNLTGSFKVIKPDKNGAVTTYSNVKPLNKHLGLNSAGQQVVSCNKTGEVIYSQVDKSKKRVLRDHMHTPLPGYPDEEENSVDSDDELELKKQQHLAMKNARLSSRSPSPVSRSRMICLNIPSEKQKAKLHRERSLSPQIMSDHLLHPPRSSSTGPRTIRNRTYQVGYGNADTPIDPPPQFATLGHKLPPKAPTPVKSMLQRSSSYANQSHVRRVPIEADSRWYYQTEQSNLSDQSSVFQLKKNRETLEETMSFVSSGSEFVDKEPLGRDRIADSTIRELDKKKKQISYDNQAAIRHSTNEPPMANSVWHKSIDEDYRKGMASNEICLPSLPNYSQDSATMSRLDKKKSSSTKLDEHQAYTLDRRYLDERKKKGILTSSSTDKDKLIKSSPISRRPTQQASDFVDNKISRRQFSSTRDLTQQQQSTTANRFNLLDKQPKQRSSSLTRYNESESDASIASAKMRTGYRAFSGLNYPLKPVTRSASMHHPSSSSSLLRKHSSAIRSTESDHGYGPPRPISRQSATSNRSTHRFSSTGQSIIQNDPVVLYIPAIDNSLKEMNSGTTLVASAKAGGKSTGSKTLGNKKLASSVNNLNSVSRTNSILSKLKTTNTTGSKKDISKSTDKLNEVTAKLNGYQTSKTLAGKMGSSKTTKQVKRSQSIPKNAKLPLLTKLKNKLKSKEQQ